MTQKYYKIVQNMSSIYATGEHTVVYYTPGEWTEPQQWAKESGLGLWVCDSLENAVELSTTILFAHQIWECEVDDIRSLIHVEWETPIHRIRPDSWFEFPLHSNLGYVSAMRVKLTNLIEDVPARSDD